MARMGAAHLVLLLSYAALASSFHGPHMALWSSHNAVGSIQGSGLPLRNHGALAAKMMAEASPSSSAREDPLRETSAVSRRDVLFRAVALGAVGGIGGMSTGANAAELSEQDAMNVVEIMEVQRRRANAVADAIDRTMETYKTVQLGDKFDPVKVLAKIDVLAGQMSSVFMPKRGSTGGGKPVESTLWEMFPELNDIPEAGALKKAQANLHNQLGASISVIGSKKATLESVYEAFEQSEASALLVSKAMIDFIDACDRKFPVMKMQRQQLQEQLQQSPRLPKSSQEQAPPQTVPPQGDGGFGFGSGSGSFI